MERLDLNLLVALEALLEERSVTRAAQRLRLSQPTLSIALGRLRRHFGDELLARSGNVYTLTPLAERLLDATGEALRWADRAFDTRPQFDPATADREFALVVSDAHLPLFARALADLVQREAPAVRLRFEHSTARLIGRPEEHLRAVDALVLPQGLLAEMSRLELYQDRLVCVVAAGSTPPGGLTTDDLRRRPWVLPYDPRRPLFSALQHLRQAGIEPVAGISTEDFLAVPHLVTASDRIGLMPASIAGLVAEERAVEIAATPFDLGVLVETLWWHPSYDRDPGHLWLRRMATEAARHLTDQAATQLAVE